MESLLGQFYSRIKGSQENIASEGLVYILNRSRAARQAINNIIRNDCGLDFPDLKFEAQTTGKNLERPDIIGRDPDGNKVLILEAKFWSALTDNQPVEYLNSLADNSALVFICPDARVRPVFSEVDKRLIGNTILSQQVGDWYLKIPEHNKHLIIKTWAQILEPIRDKLFQEKEHDLLADINQIIGLCDIIDNTAFLPMLSDDLSPKFARRINSYFEVIDKVVDELKQHKRAVTISLRSAGSRTGYVRYFKMDQIGVALYLHFENWEKFVDTPFWATFKDNLSGQYWSMSDTFRNCVKNTALKLGYQIYENNYEIFISLPPLLNVTGNEVVKDMTNRILNLNEELTRNTIAE